MVVDTLKVHFDLMAKPLKKIWKLMKESSPLLKQQLIIAKKAWLLVWRPFGDLIGKFLRPFLILFLKIGLFLYKWLSKLFGTMKADEEDIEKQESFMAKEREMRREMRGETRRIEGSGEAVTTRQQKKEQNSFVKWKENLKRWYIDLAKQTWVDFLNGLKIINGWIKSGWKSLTDYIKSLGPFLREEWEMFLGELDTIKDWLLDKWDSFLSNFDTIGDWLLDKWGFFLLDIDTIGTWLKDKIESLWKSLKDGFNYVITAMKGWASDLWSKIKSIFRGKSKDKDDDDSFKAPKSQFRDYRGASRVKAIGGMIGETGQYQLHAGERVVTAADVQRMNQNPVNVTNHYNISANISSDIDIRQLAKRLAALQEIELRRRVSY